MINMRDNNEVKEYLDAKISWLESEVASDKAQFNDPYLAQQARGRFYRGEWCLKVLNEIKGMLI